MASLKIMMNSNSVTSLNSLTNSNDYDQNQVIKFAIKKVLNRNFRIASRKRDVVFGYVQIKCVTVLMVAAEKLVTNRPLATGSPAATSR